MEILIGVIALGGIFGLVLKWARDNARREQEGLESLRAIVEGKQEEISRGKAS